MEKSLFAAITEQLAVRYVESLKLLELMRPDLAACEALTQAIRAEESVSSATASYSPRTGMLIHVKALSMSHGAWETLMHTAVARAGLKARVNSFDGGRLIVFPLAECEDLRHSITIELS